MASDLRLDIFQGDPLMRWLNSTQSSGRGLLLFPAVTIATFLIAAAHSDLLSQPHEIGLWCQDARAYILASQHLCKSRSDSSTMTFLRDIPTCLAIILVSIRPWLMYRQWSAISVFLDKMETRGLLRFPSGRASALAHVNACNSFFARVTTLTSYIFVLATTITLLLLQATRAGLIFPSLATRGRAQITEWWIFSRGSFAWVLYVIWGSIYVYTALLQNFYGGRTTLLAWRIRNDIFFDADPNSTDGYNGWSEVRQILRCTWGALMIDGACIALVGLSFPSERVWLIAPLLLQWLLAAPAYIGVPVHIMNLNIRKWKGRELAIIDHAQAALPQTDLQGRAAYGERAKSVRKLTVNPYAGVWSTLVTSLATIGTFGLVVQIVRLLYF